MSDAHIRWAIKRDMPSVLSIEQQCFEFPWSEDDFMRCLRQRNCIGMVAEVDDLIAGYMVYELHKNRIHLLSIAVEPAMSRRGIGTALIEKLRRKLSYERRNRLMLEVRETNVDCQLFLRSLDFKAISVLRNFYDDSDEDAFLFQYRHIPTADELAQPQSHIARAGG